MCIKTRLTDQKFIGHQVRSLTESHTWLEQLRLPVATTANEYTESFAVEEEGLGKSAVNIVAAFDKILGHNINDNSIIDNASNMHYL